MIHFAAIRGHQDAITRFRQRIASDRIAGAYLLSGPRGIGKRTLAMAVMARVLCTTPSTDDACGTCDHCVRVAAGTHPDVRLVERDPEKRDIGVDTARALTRWLSLRPLTGERKVALIVGAETLSLPAQNALLKTIEEPPGGAVLLLTATTPTLLLPTVRSRCQHVRLDALGTDDVCALLAARDVPHDRAVLVAARAEGSIGAALELLDEPGDGIRAQLLGVLPHLGQRTTAELSSLAQKMSADTDTAMLTLLHWYRDAIGIAAGVDAGPRRTPDAAGPLQALAARVPMAALLRALHTVCTTIEDLGRNANRQLAIETMLYDLRDVERGEGASRHA